MKNPLWKRLPKELAADLGKYLVIFLFMVFSIGFVSGFLVAGESMVATYDESFEKYHIEMEILNIRKRHQRKPFRRSKQKA